MNEYTVYRWLLGEKKTCLDSLEDMRNTSDADVWRGYYEQMDGLCDDFAMRFMNGEKLTLEDFENDPHIGVECAHCDEVIGPGEGTSSPHGSMHESCAREHEQHNPQDW